MTQSKFMKHLLKTAGPEAWILQAWKVGAFVICIKIFGHIVNCCSLKGKAVAN